MKLYYRTSFLLRLSLSKATNEQKCAQFGKHPRIASKGRAEAWQCANQFLLQAKIARKKTFKP